MRRPLAYLGGMAVVAVLMLLAYRTGRLDERAQTPKHVCPRPEVTAAACMPVWFNAQPGDMAAARKRMCPKR